MHCEKVGVVILTYNDIDDTLECLQSLKASRSVCIQSLVVVDNGSEKECQEKLRSELSRIEGAHFLALQHNIGFSAGMNCGIAFVRERGAKHVLILNNDTVLEPGCVKYMVQITYEFALVGVVSPKIRQYDQPDIFYSAGSRRGLQFARPRGSGQRDVRQFDKPERCDFASGCAMLITDTTLTKVGGFDERFFFGCEDRELAFRCRKSGLEIWYEPLAVIYHKKGQARKNIPNSERIYLVHLSQLFYIKISRSKFRWLVWYALYMIHFATLFPVRLAIEHGINYGVFKCLGAVWSAWVRAYNAERAFPRRMW